MENFYMSKETFKEILSRFKGIIFDSTDLEDVFDLVHDLYAAEADAMKEKCPWATRSISEYEAVVIRMSYDGSDFCEMYDEVMGE